VVAVAIGTCAVFTVVGTSASITGTDIFALSSAPAGGMIFGVSGLSGSNYPSTFISEATSQYKITAFRMSTGVTSQIPKYVSSGAKFIYVTYGESPTDNPQTDAQNLVSFLKANPQVNLVGLANEPNINGWTPAQYAPFLVAAYNAIKAAGLTQHLCAFEVAGSGGSGPQSWIQQVINDGGAGHYDMACIHIYPPQGDQSSISSNLDAIHSIVGTLMMITESNIANCPYVPNVPNPAQAMKNLFSIYESKSYIRGVFWYDLADSNACGLFNNSYSPNPQAQTYLGIISSYTGGGGAGSSTTTTTTTSSASSSSSSSTSTTLSTTTSSASTSSTSSSSTTISTSSSSSSDQSQTSTSSTSITSSTQSSSSPSLTSSTSTTLDTTTTHGHSGGGQGEGRGYSRGLVNENVSSSSSSSNTTSGYQGMMRVLAMLSPSRDPPVGYGFVTYEVLLTGGLVGVIISLRRKYQSGIGRWRW
jgi:hypothetical protein